MADRYLWLWSDGDLNKDPELWHREGQCHRCGACCELAGKLSYITGPESDSVPPDTEKRDNSGWPPGRQIVAEQWEGPWVFWQPKDPDDRVPMCSSYEGDGICGRYENGDRSEICRKWPILPADLDLFPECGYSFRRAER